MVIFAGSPTGDTLTGPPRSHPALDLTDLHGSLSDPVLSTMTFLNEIAGRYPDAVSFAPGRPYEGAFDPATLPRMLETYLEHLRRSGQTPEQVRAAIFQYGDTAGQIRDLIAEMLLLDEDIVVPQESLVLTVGCQEAIFLVLRALCRDARDVLLVDSPCYVGATGAAQLLDMPVVAVPGTGSGVDLVELDRIVRGLRDRGRRPRALYVVPDCSNPTGVSMGSAERSALLDAARRLDLLLLEDNPYGLFSSKRVPTLKSLDRTRQVVYLGSFAKSAFPGARLGYVVADQAVSTPGGSRLLAAELSKIKSMVTVNTPSVTQAMIAGLLLANGGGLREANMGTAKHYQDTMRCLRASLAREFPAPERERLGVRWNEPTGGFFLTLDVPFEADEAALRTSAEEFGVIWTPMRYFHPAGTTAGNRQIRLSCSCLSPEKLEIGVTRLGALVRHLLPPARD